MKKDIEKEHDFLIDLGKLYTDEQLKDFTNHLEFGHSVHNDMTSDQLLLIPDVIDDIELTGYQKELLVFDRLEFIPQGLTYFMNEEGNIIRSQLDQDLNANESTLKKEDVGFNLKSRTAIIDKAVDFHINNNYKGKIETFTDYGTKNPIINAFKEHTGHDLNVADLKIIEQKVEDINREQRISKDNTDKKNNTEVLPSIEKLNEHYDKSKNGYDVQGESHMEYYKAKHPTYYEALLKDQLNKDIVLEEYPRAVVQELPQGNYYAILSNSDPVNAKRLSTNPFEGKTATTLDQAWQEAAKTVIIDKAVEFHINNNYKGKIENLIAYGTKNPLVNAFKEHTGHDLKAADLKIIDEKVENINREQKQGISY